MPLVGADGVTPQSSAKTEKDGAIEIAQKAVDNPGAGDCAFYAFAVGLINIIQEEKVLNPGRRSPLFERWIQLDSSIEGLYDSICEHHFDSPSYELLNSLQRSLRLITYSYKLAELRQVCAIARENNAYLPLVATSSFVNFSAIYYGNQQDTDPRFNEYVGSAPILDAFNQIDPIFIEANNEQLVFAPLFMRLLYGVEDVSTITPGTEPSIDSPILASMLKITEDFFWGTHLDLDYLATAFGVNLHTLSNGVPRQEFVDNPDHHTITVNNLGDAHWITILHVAQLENKTLPSIADADAEIAKKAALEEIAKKAALEEIAKKVAQEEIAKKAAQEEVANKAAREEAVKKVHAKKAEKDVSYKDALMKTVIKDAVDVIVPEESIKKAAPKDSDDTAKRVNTSPKPQNNKQKPKVEDVNLNAYSFLDREDKLSNFKDTVNRAVTAYCNYTSGIWFSFFHYHGETGRKRARAFLEQMQTIKTYDDAVHAVVSYLEDKTNGNTHPHSFRTMLLHELLDKPDNLPLKALSHNFSDQLNGFKLKCAQEKSFEHREIDEDLIVDPRLKL